MKVSELFEAEVTKHPILDELKGKKLDYAGMRKFVASHPDVFEVRPNGSSFKVKKDARVNVGPVKTALKKASDESVVIADFGRGQMYISWPSDHPVKSTVVLDQPVMAMKGRDGLSVEDYKAKKSEQYKLGMENATLNKEDPAAKGWFVSHGNAAYPVYGRFDEGPFKGDIFMVSNDSVFTRVFKKGDKIRVTADSTYGRVKLIKD